MKNIHPCIKEKDKQLLKSEKQRDRQDKSPGDRQEKSPGDGQKHPGELAATPPVRTVPTKAQMKAQDPFDFIMTGSLPSTSRLPPPQSSRISASSLTREDADSDLDDSPDRIDLMTKQESKEEDKKPESVVITSSSRRKATQNKRYAEDDEEDENKIEPLTSSARRASQKKKDEDDEKKIELLTSARKATQNKKYVEDDEDDEKKIELLAESTRKAMQNKKYIEDVYKEEEDERNKDDLPSISRKSAKNKKYVEEDEEEEKKESSSTPLSSSARRRAIQKPEFKDEMVSCPECDFQCLHSKIVQHLKRCTKKMAQTKKSSAAKPNKPQHVKSTLTPTTPQSESKPSVLDNKSHQETEIKKPKQSDIVKKAFLKKFEAQQRMEYFSDSDDREMNSSSRKERQESESSDKEDKQPSLKLKFSRKDSGSDLSHFEVSNENLSTEVDEKVSSKDDTSLSAILRNINADRSEAKQPPRPSLPTPIIAQISPPKIGAKPDKLDDSSDDEVVPQKSFRLHSFIESLRAMQARLPQRKEDPPPKLPPPPPAEQSESPSKLSSLSITPVESSNLKNKWLQSLENRSKVKPPEPAPVVNKIQSEIAQMKNKESLIYNKAKLKAYPETPLKPSSLREPVSLVKVEEEVSVAEPPGRKKKAVISLPRFEEGDAPVKNKRRNENNKQASTKDLQKEEYHDGRPSLRGNKMIPCPICGSEYAIADNLQKHIDKDHFGETDRVFLKRVKSKESKDKERPEASSKKKKKTSLTSFEDEEDDFLGDSRPTLDTSTAEEKFDSLLASSSSTKKEKKKEDNVEDEDDEEESTKLTEYEIFQKLQLKETSKTEKKRVECNECGKMLPVNTIKRHLLKHEKDAMMEKEGLVTVETAETVQKPAKSKPQPKPRGRSKTNSASTGRNRKQEPKHLEEKKAEAESVKSLDEDDERIPCPLNLKKMIMKRHLMKPETDQDDAEKHEVKVEEGDETDGGGRPPAATRGRKKRTTASPSIAKKQSEKQTKKRKVDDPSVMYAPIEITPTKEYWEYEKEKREKSFDFPSTDEDDLSSAKKSGKLEPRILVNKSLRDLKEAEKSRNTSEEESESENSLEAAVRKVVSYR